MNLRFYIDPETDLPHIYEHGVTEEEVQQVLQARGEDREATRNTRHKLGQSWAGRYLRVIYSLDPDADSVFVITAYELKGKDLKAYRRRQRRRYR